MRALFSTLKTMRSTLIALSVSVCVFVLAVWLPNLQLLSILWSGSLPLADKITLPVRLLASSTTNVTTLSALYTVIISVLSGINVALIVELVRKRRMVTGGAVAGGAGVFAGALGVGCAACGSLILTALIGTTVGTGALALLPLGGAEFGIIGVGLLVYATYLLTKQINKATCEIIV